MAESIANGAVYVVSPKAANGSFSITRTDVQPNITIDNVRPPDPCELDPVDPCVPPGGGGNPSPPNPSPPNPLPPGIYVEEQTVCSLATRVLPLRQVRVVAKHWFKVWRGYTDDNGRFTVTKRFKNKVKVIVKTKNNHAKISKVRGVRVWQMLFPCKKRIGVLTTTNCRASAMYLTNQPMAAHTAKSWLIGPLPLHIIVCWSLKITRLNLGWRSHRLT